MSIEVQARHTDPSTSHEAAALLNQKRGKIKDSVAVVVKLLKSYPVSSDFDIAALWPIYAYGSPSSPGLPRMARLWAQREGLVVPAGYGVHKGRRCRTWQLGPGTPVAPKDSPLRVARRRIAELEAEVARLRTELANIANAKPDQWGAMSDQFQAWAQNRARFAITHNHNLTG